MLSNFGTFKDREVEYRYIASQRDARIATIRWTILIGIAALAVLFVIPGKGFNDSHSDNAIPWIIGIISVALGGLWLLQSPLYKEQYWTDFLICMPLTVAILLLMRSRLEAGLDFSHLPLTSKSDVWQLVYFLSLYFSIISICSSIIISSRPTNLWFFYAGLYAVFIYIAQATTQSLSITLNFTVNSVFVVLFCWFLNWDRNRKSRLLFVSAEALVDEQKKTESLLYNVLPQEVANRIRAGETIADSFSDVSAIFVDLVGFSSLTKSLSPGHLLELLNTYFSAADRCASKHGIEKVKTIGDAYLAVAGGMSSKGRGSIEALAFAHDLIDATRTIQNETCVPLRVRIGIHTGPVIGGVVGSERMAYDYWGDTMNVASRIESTAPVNGIAVSQSTYYQTLRAQEYHSPVAIVLKGVGEVNVYVAAPRTGISAPALASLSKT